MSLSIGRAGLTGATIKVVDWDMQGDTLTLLAQIEAATDSEMLTVCDQLGGLEGNQDEPVVPVTWSESPRFDGFYRVRSLDVGAERNRYIAKRLRFSASLEQVSGFAGPLMETVITGAVRSNAHSITSASAVAAIGVPDSVLEFDDDSEPTSSDLFTRSAEDGDVRIVKDSTYVRRQSWVLPPSDWYLSSARLDIGAPLRPAVGQQIPATASDWVLSNGLVRVGIVPTGFSLSGFDGDVWSTAKVLKPSAAGVAWLPQLSTSLRVLRNSPEEVIVRVPVTIPSAVLSAASLGSLKVDIDIALRRGERTARFVLLSSTDLVLGVELATAEAGTDITGGLRATSNDADGHRYVLSSPVAHTTDNVQGGLEATASDNVFPFAAGLEIDGSTAAANDAATALVNQYMAATSERVVISSR